MCEQCGEEITEWCWDICPQCGGTGFVGDPDGDDFEDCEYCDGVGDIQYKCDEESY